VHLDDLRAMHDLNARVIAFEPSQLCFDPRRITGQVKSRDIGKISQGEDSTLDKLRRAIIVAHGIEDDLHQRVNSEIERAAGGDSYWLEIARARFRATHEEE
jgi:hypothetical protein